MDLDTLLAEATALKASDIHLAYGQPPVYRVGGELRRREGTPALDTEAMDALILPALPEPQRLTLQEGIAASVEATLAREETSLSYQLMAFRAQGRITATIRLLSQQIPTLEKIGGDARDVLERVAKEPRGLILFTGPTGSGKQTTASVVIETINLERCERIFVIEESPYFTFESKQSVVTTLYIGQDFDSYERAAQTILRGADPDVVLFNDLPTLESVRQALLLAETGHLVFASLQGESAVGVVTELIQAFPEPRDPVRSLLSRTLVAVFNQRLMARADRRGRVAAYEILLGTPTVREALRNGAAAETFQAAIADGRDAGMQTLQGAIDALLAAGTISEETAAQHRADRSRSEAFPLPAAT